MTTPKPPTLAMWTAIDADAKQPFRELAEEFRRLAAEERHFKYAPWNSNETTAAHQATAKAWEQAAQMLEERLNG